MSMPNSMDQGETKSIHTNPRQWQIELRGTPLCVWFVTAKHKQKRPLPSFR